MKFSWKKTTVKPNGILPITISIDDLARLETDEKQRIMLVVVSNHRNSSFL